MTLRRWGVYIVGTDEGVPFEDFRGRCFSYVGARIKAHHCLYVRGVSVVGMARATGWNLQAQSEIRRLP